MLFIHIGVGFGVARSTVRAMPEPRCVGRVISRFPRFFMYSDQLLNPPSMGVCLVIIHRNGQTANERMAAAQQSTAKALQ